MVNEGNNNKKYFNVLNHTLSHQTNEKQFLKLFLFVKNRTDFKLYLICFWLWLFGWFVWIVVLLIGTLTSLCGSNQLFNCYLSIKIVEFFFCLFLTGFSNIGLKLRNWQISIGHRKNTQNSSHINFNFNFSFILRFLCWLTRKKSLFIGQS